MNRTVSLIVFNASLNNMFGQIRMVYFYSTLRTVAIACHTRCCSAYPEYQQWCQCAAKSIKQHFSGIIERNSSESIVLSSKHWYVISTMLFNSIYKCFLASSCQQILLGLDHTAICIGTESEHNSGCQHVRFYTS